MAKKSNSTGDGTGFLFILFLLAAVFAIMNALIPIALGLGYLVFAFKYRVEIFGFGKRNWRSIITRTEEAKLRKLQKKLNESLAKYKFVKGKLERSRSPNSIRKWLQKLQKLAETIKKLESDFDPYLRKYESEWDNLSGLYSVKNGFFLTSIAYWLIGYWVSTVRQVDLWKIIPLAGLPNFNLFSLYDGAFLSVLIVFALTIVAFFISLFITEFAFKKKYGDRDKYSYNKEKLNFEELYRRFSKKLNNSQEEEESQTKPASEETALMKHLRVLNLEAHQLCRNIIKSRFRELIKKYHPDTVINATKALKEKAERKTREILEAYEYLMQKVA